MNHDPLIIGHRGASAVAPENTLAAFARGLADGADGIEFDVRRSRDSVPVVIHDATLRRTGLVANAVGDLTAEELQHVNVGKWFYRTRPALKREHLDERLPTLAQVLQQYSDSHALLYLEIKGEPDEGQSLAVEISRLIAHSKISDRTIVLSFDLSVLANFKRMNPRIRTGALFEPRLSHPLSAIPRSKIIDLAVASGANEIALHYSLVSRKLVEAARQSGLNVVVWTVDKPEWLQRGCAMGIRALITNNPGLFAKSRPVAQK